jgi:hypothetical protein
MFEDSRKFTIENNWKIFARQDKVFDEPEKAPSFEETMIIDTIRAMRKDMK